MQKYKIIEDAIAQKDIEALREAVGSICYASRDFSSGEFDQVVNYIESKGIRLKDDSLIGPPTISSQKDTFDEEDFTIAVFELKNNFCDERIQDVRTIGQALYGSDSQKESLSKDTFLGKHTQTNKNEQKENKVLDPNLQSHPHKIAKALVMCVVAVIILMVILLILSRKRISEILFMAHVLPHQIFSMQLNTLEEKINKYLNYDEIIILFNSL